MTKMRPEPIGRTAINQLKAAYRAKLVFDNAAAIRDWLLASLNAKPKHISTRLVVDWDRQARLELADELISVTPPVSALGWRRNPTALAAERNLALKSRLSDAESRTRNLMRMAKADASQQDASIREHQLLAKVEVASLVLTEAKQQQNH